VGFVTAVKWKLQQISAVCNQGIKNLGNTENFVVMRNHLSGWKNFFVQNQSASITTAAAATVLFVAHVAKGCSCYIDQQIDHYWRELKEKTSNAQADKSKQEIGTNPRCKKKKGI
jgi:hypothetical protein